MDIDVDSHQGETKKRVLKIIVVGDMATGKTSLIRMAVNGTFSEFYKSTIGVDFAHKKINVNENLCVDLQLWDISGQERFASVTHMYYNEAVAAMVVFDLKVPQSLEIAKIWKKDIDEKVQTADEKPIPCYLIGNKVDLCEDGKWDKTEEEMNDFCKEFSFTGFMKTSAKMGTNVSETVDTILKYIIDNDIQPYRPKELESCVDINNPNSHEKEGGKKSCC